MKNPNVDVWPEEEQKDWEKAEFSRWDVSELSCPICFAIVREDLWFLHRDWHEDNGSR